MEAGKRDAALDKALTAARARGRLKAAEVFAQSDMVRSGAMAERLGITRVTVNTRRRAGQLLGLEGARQDFRFPVWQIDANGEPYREIPALLERLGGPWAVYRFLLQPHGSLGGLTGRQALERGRGAGAVAAAEGIACGDFT